MSRSGNWTAAYGRALALPCLASSPTVFSASGRYNVEVYEVGMMMVMMMGGLLRGEGLDHADELLVRTSIFVMLFDVGWWFVVSGGRGGIENTSRYGRDISNVGRKDGCCCCCCCCWYVTYCTMAMVFSSRTRSGPGCGVGLVVLEYKETGR